MLCNSQLATIKASLERADLVYPSYYLQPFHAYDEGNLNWLAAFEVDPASYAMAIRTYKNEPWSYEQSFSKLRSNITDTIKVRSMGFLGGVTRTWPPAALPAVAVLALASPRTMLALLGAR